MAKPTGARCDLCCDRCFFLDKAELYPGSDFTMSDEAMQAYIEQVIQANGVLLDESWTAFLRENELFGYKRFDASRMAWSRKRCGPVRASSISMVTTEHASISLRKISSCCFARSSS